MSFMRRGQFASKRREIGPVAPPPVRDPSEITIEHKHKGACNELIATIWLLKQGYDVFRNVSQHGAIDIIAIRDGKVLYIDVTVAYRYSVASGESKLSTGNYFARRQAAKRAGVKLSIILVDSLDDSCSMLDFNDD